MNATRRAQRSRFTLAACWEGGLELGERAPLIGFEDLALDDADVELNVVEPDARIGVWTTRIRGHRSRSRASVRGPQCELPLSTTQSTRRAECTAPRS